MLDKSLSHFDSDELSSIEIACERFPWWLFGCGVLVAELAKCQRFSFDIFLFLLQNQSLWNG